MFLDIKGSPFDFWEYTVAEIVDLIDSYNRVYTQKRKEQIINNYQLSQMIANHVSCLLSSDSKPLEVWEYAPDLFDKEREQVEEERRQHDLLIHKERMRAFATQFNNHFRKEDAHEHDS